MLAPSEGINWLQNVMACTGAADRKRVPQIGFGAKHRKAVSQELLNRLRTAITTARDVSSRTQIGGSTADELAKWARLRDDGAISEDEFAVEKARLLGH